MLRKYVDQRLHIIDTVTSRKAETQTVEEIVQHIKVQVGGRFLERIGSGWVEASDEKARTKVANCFRTLRWYLKNREGTSILP